MRQMAFNYFPSRRLNSDFLAKLSWIASGPGHIGTVAKYKDGINLRKLE